MRCRVVYIRSYVLNQVYNVETLRDYVVFRSEIIVVCSIEYNKFVDLILNGVIAYPQFYINLFLLDW